MEKMSFVKDGVLRLPPGFRFHPTDEELVVQYLKRKVFSNPLPASVITEFDVCKSNPWDLPGDSQQERYFFSTREVKYPNGNRTNRATISGYWKATGIDKKIMTSKGHQVVGMKKTLVFYKGKAPNGTRTDWIMHEYRLANVESITAGGPQQANSLIEDNWVLCRIFLKKRGSKSEEEIIISHKLSNNGSKATSLMKKKPVFYDFMAYERTDLNLAPSSSSSDSSGITEVSKKEEEDHEENSSCNSFITPRSKSWL